ncbi:MAG: hypothetical protein SRB1_02441 [Desulfobacteraceae bacterium Eth-SRB1]|nr:MAG: hypothetical protein SRB1_02441 [Desulfobacteraceae bacterium Eth-SRB1]
MPTKNVLESYRCIGDPMDLEIIAIGPREGLAVYRKAEKRRGEK